MVLFRFFQKWRPRGAKSVWRFILGFTAIVLAFLVMRNNSTEQRDINSRSDLEQYVVKNESDSEDGWSPLDTVWSDAMSDRKFYLASRDNISIVLWKPGKNPKKVKRPFRRTKKRVKRPGPKMAGKSRASANEKPVLPEGLEKSMYFNVTYVGKRFAKTSSSTWNNWPINIEALKEIRKQASSLHPLVGMDNKEIIPSSKQVLTCGKGLPTCKLEGRNAIRHYRTCAVVGNSGILSDSLCGGEIDAHDYVIRFGVAPTVGYKNDVGSKRNITFLNKDILLKINESLHLGGSKDVYTPRLKRMNGSILMFTTEKRREWTDDIKCLIEIARKQKLAFTLQKNTGNPAVTIRDTVKATMPDLVEKLGDIETTGTLALFVASTFCSRINLYGFYPFHKDTHGRDISYHYYTADNVKEIVQDEIRKFSAQHAISRRYDKLGVIRHVIDRCQQTPLADERSPAGGRKLTSAKGEKSSKKFKGKDTKDKSKK